MGYLTPELISLFYESLTKQEVFERSLILLIFLICGEYLNRFIFSLSTHKYIQLLLLETRKKSFSLWLNSSLGKKKSKQEDYPLGEVLARIMNDTDAVREVVSSGSFAIFIDIIFIFSCLLSFLKLNSSTGLLIFTAEVLACLLLIKGSKLMASVFMEVRRSTGQMARTVTDITSGLVELFFNPNNKYASKKSEKIFEDFLKKQLKANIWDAGYYSAAESLYPILIALIMIALPFSKITEVAILAALIDLIQKSITPIKDVASKISVLARAQGGLERIHQFNESFVLRSSSINLDIFLKISVDNISFNLNSFQYDNGFVLSGIKFNLKKGETLGILGESGCGKSTLLKLLSGQYRSFDGVISIDGNLLDLTKQDDLEKCCTFVSLISQDSHVFTETLKFNITLGEDIAFDDFWQLALDSISYLRKWNIRPSDLVKPSFLSLGQKQLISGLRAMFLKKPIILMDEISSGLDSELEFALRDLQNFFRLQSITIIVTHRLETILNSDFLLLLKSGKTECIGPYEEIKGNEQFREFLEHLKS